MRCALRLVAVTVILAALGWWVVAGAHVGWWRTRVGVERTDEITGLSVIEWREGFVPGVETPAAGLLLGGVFFAATIFYRRKLPPHQPLP